MGVETGKGEGSDLFKVPCDLRSHSSRGKDFRVISVFRGGAGVYSGVFGEGDGRPRGRRRGGRAGIGPGGAAAGARGNLFFSGESERKIFTDISRVTTFKIVYFLFYFFYIMSLPGIFRFFPAPPSSSSSYSVFSPPAERTFGYLKFIS